MGRNTLSIRVICVLATLAVVLGCIAPPTAKPPTPVDQPTITPDGRDDVPTPSGLPEGDAPDAIFHGGTVLTMDNDRSQAQAVAVRGDRIVAVGNDAEILALQGPETHLIDLDGLTLMPGDIIVTGTPAGVGLFRDPPLFLEDGDVVEIEIERIGTIRSTVNKL